MRRGHTSCSTGPQARQPARRSRRIGQVRCHATVDSGLPNLAVLGDSADGFPGVPGWGEKAAAMTLSRYPHLEDIPKDWQDWHPSISNARRLSTSLFNSWDDALLFRTLATLRLDAPVFDTVEDLRWQGPHPGFEE